MNTTICMRADLAEEGLSVPASRTFSNYDTLDDDLYISAEELEGATEGDDPADPDDHPFCYVQLRDGRSLYFMSVDLDFHTVYDPLEIVQTAESCSYCGGNCPNDEDHACDGYLGDIDGLYSEAK